MVKVVHKRYAGNGPGSAKTPCGMEFLWNNRPASTNWGDVTCLRCLKSAPHAHRVQSSEKLSRRDVAILGGDPSL